MGSQLWRVRKCFFLTLFCLSSNAGAAILLMDESDTDDSFTERVTKQDIVHDTGPMGNSPQIGRTSKLIRGKEAIVAFTAEEYNRVLDYGTNPDWEKIAKENEERDKNRDPNIYLNVFVRNSRIKYRQLPRLVACEPIGYRALLKAFFYFTIKDEASPVLGVICSWQCPKLADCCPNDEVQLFRASTTALAKIPKERFRTILYRREKRDVESDVTCERSNFNNVKDVKMLLAKKANGWR